MQVMRLAEGICPREAQPRQDREGRTVCSTGEECNGQHGRFLPATLLLIANNSGKGIPFASLLKWN